MISGLKGWEHDVYNQAMSTTRQDKQLNFQNQRRKNYFEGWYFKQVSSDESVIFSIIPSMMRVNNQEQALIQVILAEKVDGAWRILTDRLDFPMSAFLHTSDPFTLNIGGNTFSREGLSLNINTPALPTSALAPTIMGPFSYLPFMECIHGINSLHHSLTGTLQIGSKTVSFDGGVGYIEKDWGHSFPKSYLWLQSNHFARRPSCLFFSWANIPLGPFAFPGFICHLWMAGQHHRFATYNGARCVIHDMSEDKVSLTLKKREISLSIHAAVDVRGALSAPKHGQMDHQIKEGLAGTISFQLENKKTNEVMVDTSSLSGVEIVPRLIRTPRG